MPEKFITVKNDYTGTDILIRVGSISTVHEYKIKIRDGYEDYESFLGMFFWRKKKKWKSLTVGVIGLINGNHIRSKFSKDKIYNLIQEAFNA